MSGQSNSDITTIFAGLGALVNIQSSMYNSFEGGDRISFICNKSFSVYKVFLIKNDEMVVLLLPCKVLIWTRFGV